MALNSTADINRMVDLANSQLNLTNPEVFYSKQLCDTIRLDAGEYKYYKLADVTPISNKADKLTVRRWSPLQAHTIPLVEGVPPKSDKGAVIKYEIGTNQYGRYMEFTDKVNFAVVDPVIAHYTREYSLVALETLDMLAREVLFSQANKNYAGQVAGFEDLTLESKPTLTDLRLIVLHLKRALVKPRANGRFYVICSPEFTYDMVTDPTVEKFMTINQTTKDTYDGSVLFPLFGMQFDESMVVPASGEFTKIVEDTPKKCLRIYRDKGDGTYEYRTIDEDTPLDASASGGSGTTCYTEDADGGYTHEAMFGDKDLSFIPVLKSWNIDELKAYDGDGTASGNTLRNDWMEFKAHHILVVGKEALVRTQLEGEGNAKMYTKPLGSSGVLDPIDQRQSIGFKINSVGFGTTRSDAIQDYICVPSTANLA